jgi:hypothetical protein
MKLDLGRALLSTLDTEEMVPFSEGGGASDERCESQGRGVSRTGGGCNGV